MQRIKESDNPYKIGDKIEFLNKLNIWVKGEIVGFKVNKYVFKAIIKTDSKRLHYVCVCSLYLRKVK